MNAKIDDIKSILLEHQRQITQLFELYERQKQSHDNKTYIINQSFEVMRDSIQDIQKDTRTYTRSLQNVERAIHAFGVKEVQERTLEIMKTTRELVNRQNTLQEYLSKQSQYIAELEKMLNRVIALTDNSNLILNYAEQNGVKLDNLISRFGSVDHHSNTWELTMSPGFEAAYGVFQDVPPLNLSEQNV